MIRSLWISKTGMDAQQSQLDVISNNLANVNTTGFKRSRAVFEDLLYQNVREPGAQSSQQTTLPSGMQIGTGTRIVATERLHTQGNLQQTGNSTDVAINGNGFFQVQLPGGQLTPPVLPPDLRSSFEPGVVFHRHLGALADVLLHQHVLILVKLPIS